MAMNDLHSRPVLDIDNDAHYSTYALMFGYNPEHVTNTKLAEALHVLFECSGCGNQVGVEWWK